MYVDSQMEVMLEEGCLEFGLIVELLRLSGLFGLQEIHRDMNAVGNQFEEIVTQLKYEHFYSLTYYLKKLLHLKVSMRKILKYSPYRYYEDIPSYIRTVNEIEAYEEFLRETMNQIQMQKAKTYIN